MSNFERMLKIGAVASFAFGLCFKVKEINMDGTIKHFSCVKALMRTKELDGLSLWGKIIQQKISAWILILFSTFFKKNIFVGHILIKYSTFMANKIRHKP